MQDDVVCCKITQKKDINGLCYENIKNNIYICTPKITTIYMHAHTTIAITTNREIKYDFGKFMNINGGSVVGYYLGIQS